MSQTINKDELKKTIVFNVKSIYRKTIDEATPAMVYQAVALAVKDMIIDRWIATHKEYEDRLLHVHGVFDRSFPRKQYHQPL